MKRWMSAAGATALVSLRASSTSNGASGSGFFGSIKNMYREFELNKDRKLDAEAFAEAREVEEERWRAAGHGGATDTLSAAPLPISRNPLACPRSVLFLPGSKPRAMQKSLSLPADCFIIDLEDSVGPSMKRDAREHIRAFMDKVRALEEAADKNKEEGEKPFHRPRYIVRVNSPDYDAATAMLDLEMVGLLGKDIEGVAIPKITPRSYDLIKDYIHPDHALWAFFESPQSVMEASQICGQGVYRAAVMGYNDLSLELQLPMKAPAPPAGDMADPVLAAAIYTAARIPLWKASMDVLYAARANRMYVLDAVFNDPSDVTGFRRSVQECKMLGFNGKTLIHPSQVGPTNAAYTPTPEEVTWATRVVDAMRQSEGNVATLDGRMVEDLHVHQAKRLLSLHYSAEAEKSAGVGAAAADEESGGERADVESPEVAEGGRRRRSPPSRHRGIS